MTNRIRPRCPTCQTAMTPVYRKGARGKAFVKIPDTFTCAEHGGLAVGRRKVKYVASH